MLKVEEIMSVVKEMLSWIFLKKKSLIWLMIWKKTSFRKSCAGSINTEWYYTTCIYHILSWSTTIWVVTLSLWRWQSCSTQRTVQSLLHPILKTTRMEMMLTWSYHQRNLQIFLQLISFCCIFIAYIARITFIRFWIRVIRILSKY